ncbi:MAG: TonB-dependent receptor, partial [Pseudomonadota bacterium]
KLVSNDTEASNNVGLSIAEFDEWQLSAAGTVDVNDAISVRISVQNTQSDGFVKNQFLNREDTNGVDELTAKATLFYDIDDTSSLQASLYRFDIDNGYDAFSLDNDNVTRSDQPGFDKTDADALSVKYSKDFGTIQLQTIASRLDGEFDYAYDEDWTFVGFHPFAYSSFDRYLRDIERTKLTVRVADDSSDQQRWLAGVNYFANDESLLREYTFNEGDFTSEYDPTTIALFGQYAWRLSENINVISAARLESFSADYSDNDGFEESLDDTLFAGSVEVQYDIGNNLVYSSVSRGYKAGGFNIDQRLTGDNRTFSPEYNWNIEAGIRGMALDGIAQVAVGLFYMKRTNAQVNDFATFERVTDEGTTVTSFADAIRNTDTGTNKGVELSSTWFIHPDWTVQLNAGYLDATFGNYNRLDGSFVPKQDQAQAPEFTLYASSTYAFSDLLTWFIDIDAKDEFRFSDGHNERAPFTVVVNTNVSIELGQSTLSFWVKNLFDRTVFTRGFGGFSNDPRDEFAFVEPYFQFGQQRQIGASYTYSF